MNASGGAAGPDKRAGRGAAPQSSRPSKKPAPSARTAEAEAADLPVLDSLQGGTQRIAQCVNGERAAYAEARARHDWLEREARARAGPHSAPSKPRSHSGRPCRPRAGAIDSSPRVPRRPRAAIIELSALPQQLADRRLKLMNTLAEAEAERKAASDALQTAENDVRLADQELRAVQELAANSREDMRAGARLEASTQRLETSERRIAEALQCRPEDVIATAGLDVRSDRRRGRYRRKLNGLREDRERLGGSTCAPTRKQADVAKQLESLSRSVTSDPGHQQAARRHLQPQARAASA